MDDTTCHITCCRCLCVSALSARKALLPQRILSVLAPSRSLRKPSAEIPVACQVAPAASPLVLDPLSASTSRASSARSRQSSRQSSREVESVRSSASDRESVSAAVILWSQWSLGCVSQRLERGSRGQGARLASLRTMSMSERSRRDEAEVRSISRLWPSSTPADWVASCVGSVCRSASRAAPPRWRRS